MVYDAHREGEFIVYAIADIFPGQEIILDYGDDYFHTCTSRYIKHRTIELSVQQLEEFRQNKTNLFC
jgi:SET domain-containing protein